MKPQILLGYTLNILAPSHPAGYTAAAAKPADIQDLLGGALFRALYKWMEE